MECKNTRARSRVSAVILSSISLFSALALSACGKGNDASGGGTDASFAATETRKASLPSADQVGSSGEKLTIAMRYLSMTGSSGASVASQGSVETMIDYMSKIWAQCDIRFRLEQYKAISPSEVGARFNPANYYELDNMRISAQVDTDLVMIGTGAWNRTGDLGNSGSNCYSSFPGDEAEGIVCESKTAASPVIMAHEVGHWLNLIHTDNPSADQVDDTTSANSAYNLMNHFVAASNDELTAGQCLRARRAIVLYRKNAVLAD